MIRIRQVQQADISTIISWIDSAEALMQFAGPGFQYPLTIHQFHTSLQDALRKAYILEDVSDHIVGYGELYFHENSIKLSRIIVHPDERGKGYGSILTHQLLHKGFGMPIIEMALLNVFDWNHAAIKTYQKLGFKLNPHVSYERNVNGKSWTAIEMQLQKSNYKLTNASINQLEE